MHKKNNNGLLWIILGIVAVVFFIGNNKTSTNAALAMGKDPQYQYATSLTSEFESSEKANVYTTDMTVQETARDLISKAKPREHSDLSSTEFISLMYEDQYIFIYEGEDDKTYVQVSSRQYAYRGGTTLYRSRHRGAWDFFRDYYFVKGLMRDVKRFGGRNYYDRNIYVPSATQIQKIGTPTATKTTLPKTTTPTKIQRTDTHKIRRSSTGVRRSVGGGTSFGK